MNVTLYRKFIQCFSWAVPHSPPAPVGTASTQHYYSSAKPRSAFPWPGETWALSAIFFLFFFCFFCLKLCSSEGITLWASFCFQNFQRTISKHLNQLLSIPNYYSYFKLKKIILNYGLDPKNCLEFSFLRPKILAFCSLVSSPFLFVLKENWSNSTNV